MDSKLKDLSNYDHGHGLMVGGFLSGRSHVHGASCTSGAMRHADGQLQRIARAFGVSVVQLEKMYDRIVCWTDEEDCYLLFIVSNGTHVTLREEFPNEFPSQHLMNQLTLLRK